jgi:hypothetical protein
MSMIFFSRKLGFKVEMVEERYQTKDRMKQYLRQKARDYKATWKCFVCFLLSHGREEDTFCDRDGKNVTVASLVRCFDVKRCPQLEGKPKLFFIQVSQGNNRLLFVS